jgi:hypothetical protein
MHWPEIGAAYRQIFSRVAAMPVQRSHVAVLAETVAVAGA